MLLLLLLLLLRIAAVILILILILIVMVMVILKLPVGCVTMITIRIVGPLAPVCTFSRSLDWNGRHKNLVPVAWCAGVGFGFGCEKSFTSSFGAYFSSVQFSSSPTLALAVSWFLFLRRNDTKRYDSYE